MKVTICINPGVESSSIWLDSPRFHFATEINNYGILCYHDTSQVTEELVQIILHPGLEPGAVNVFLEFICYSDGPLPEELLLQVKHGVTMIHEKASNSEEPTGILKPWKTLSSSLMLATASGLLYHETMVRQDEAPHLMNPLVESFVSHHSKISG
ncbi:hypothetical protein GOBAR_AA12868 [Gossypium barbadense]|uniref:Uncharacterized protein n=1 Tax=Gossypium barbadense TaxID=3634 RepID=A0A2P5XWR4_GOSBA|nr:hypothetical protein GOBAR_AA12868 [Gossypium barbadense]